MKKILYVKYLLAYFIFGVLSFVLIATLGSEIIEYQLLKTTSSSLYEEVHLLASREDVKHYQDPLTQDALYHNLSGVAVAQQSVILIITPDGTIALNTASAASDVSPSVIDHFDPAAFGPTYYEVSNFYGLYETEHINALFPITSDMNTMGYISIHQPIDTLYEHREELLLSVVVIFLIIFLLSLSILLVFTFTTYRPLLKIIQGATEYASGNLNYKIKLDKLDEMGYLAATMNYMSDELQKNNEYQNQFIANVSHDFRSPLTSIKGYAEAMSDGTIPAELYPKYLGIIKSEAERLDKLTRSMLALNSMNKQMLLHMAPFDINQIIKNTVAVFEGICRQKKISVNLILEGEELFVHADIEKIQQVLYNLLDNAVKFSYKNTTITIETTNRHGRVYISIKDQGEGIPNDAQHKIWDRFYKTDTSRGKDRKGTGLGLAIVKEIIQAHEQNINVISTEGVGTEFIFSLNPIR